MAKKKPKSPFNCEVGACVKALRSQRGWARAKLAEDANMSDQFLYEIESGMKGVSGKMLLQLSDALGVTTDYLLAGKDETGEIQYKEFLYIIYSLQSDALPHVKRILTELVDFAEQIRTRPISE